MKNTGKFNKDSAWYFSPASYLVKCKGGCSDLKGRHLRDREDTEWQQKRPVLCIHTAPVLQEARSWNLVFFVAYSEPLQNACLIDGAQQISSPWVHACINEAVLKKSYLLRESLNTELQTWGLNLKVSLPSLSAMVTWLPSPLSFLYYNMKVLTLYTLKSSFRFSLVVPNNFI